MQRRVINPWNWQEDEGWTWAIEVTTPFRILHTAGQVPVDAHGRLLHPGDIRAQTAAELDNLETVLTAASHTLTDVVRVDFYTTGRTSSPTTGTWSAAACYPQPVVPAAFSSASTASPRPTASSRSRPCPSEPLPCHRPTKPSATCPPCHRKDSGHDHACTDPPHQCRPAPPHAPPRPDRLHSEVSR